MPDRNDQTMPEAGRPFDLQHPGTEPPALPPSVSCRIDWYSAGAARAIEVNGVHVVIRFVGRRGRRGRIAITAPAGAIFHAMERGNRRVTG
jgi:hypothetical protein